MRFYKKISNMFHLHGAAGRLGSFQSRDIECATPGFVLPTRSGFCPSLTSEVLCEHVGEGDVLMVAVCVRDLVNVGAEFMASRGYGGFCGFPAKQIMTVVVPEDVLAPFSEAKISKKRVVVSSSKGHVNVSPAQYALLANACGADLIAFPSNEPEFNGSAKVCNLCQTFISLCLTFSPVARQERKWDVAFHGRMSSSSESRHGKDNDGSRSRLFRVVFLFAFDLFHCMFF
jgi:hypothetical protein